MDTNKEVIARLKEESVCLECQECCKWLTVVWEIDKFDDELRDFYIARGCRFTIQGRWIHVCMPSTCQFLESMRGCTIYEERPELCRKYDGREDVTMKGICKLG